MSKALELRAKRSELWEKAKAFLDNAKRDGNVLLAEDVATYEKMESDISALGREIEMVERQTALDLELNKPLNTPITNNPAKTDKNKTGRATDEYKGSFWGVMRGKPTSEALNSLSIGVDSEGGFLVPDEFESTIISALADDNIIRSVARVITSSSGDKKIPVVAGHGVANWIDEGKKITESDEQFGQINLGSHKLATIIKISEELINDSAFNLEQYIAQEFVRRMATAEEEAFISGDGTGKPTGFLPSASLGVTTASANAITADEVIDLYHSLRAPYRKNACFILSDAVIKTIRTLKDSTGQYMWQPGLQEGTPDKLLGRPVKTSTFMPQIASTKRIIAFGDFSYYWIADRQGRVFQRLNELYAENGQIGFKATQRVDGKLTLPEAIKVLAMKA